MLRRMKRAAMLVFLAVGSAAMAGTVYKSVGPDGVTIYSDRQVPGSVPVDLPESSTFSPRALPAAAEPPPLAAEPLSTGEYGSLAIVAPRDEETLYSRDLRVDVEVAIDPALQEGHTLSLVLDGNEIAKGLRNTRMRLTDLERGPHRLEASVYDSEGKLIERSPSIRFYVVTETVIKEQQDAQKEQWKKETADNPAASLEKRVWDKWVQDLQQYQTRIGGDPLPKTAPPVPPIGNPPDSGAYKAALDAYNRASQTFKDTHRAFQQPAPNPARPFTPVYTPGTPAAFPPGGTPSYAPAVPNYQPKYAPSFPTTSR
jgi:hypothetical protein